MRSVRYRPPFAIKRLWGWWCLPSTDVVVAGIVHVTEVCNRGLQPSLLLPHPGVSHMWKQCLYGVVPGYMKLCLWEASAGTVTALSSPLHCCCHGTWVPIRQLS